MNGLSIKERVRPKLLFSVGLRVLPENLRFVLSKPITVGNLLLMGIFFGNFKAVAIPHRALIANIIQMAAHNQVDKLHGPRDNRSYRPGDVALGGR